jgi:uncharacterized protein
MIDTNVIESIIEKTAAHVSALMRGEGSGHDWFHVERVWRTARTLAEREDADADVVELAALLHDVGDHKFHGGDETVGPRMAREWLESLAVDPEVVEHVAAIIHDLSFKGAGVPTPMPTVEGMCVQDADRLDAIGAIGIARAFAYGGHKGRALYDPDVPPEMHQSFEAYKQSSAPTINHFYEKLLLLKDLMNTATARTLAEERHRYMEQFLDQFYAEWNGPKPP